MCYSDCGIGYFADNYFKQCRKCHETCYTCSGKYNNNCLSCTGEYYYIQSRRICVKNCQEYGLVISSEKSNTCKELYSKSYITSPVYLNNSYDYNPLNDDYISKIINRDNFFEIEGHLDDLSYMGYWFIERGIRKSTLKNNSLEKKQLIAFSEIIPNLYSAFGAINSSTFGFYFYFEQSEIYISFPLLADYLWH